MKSNQDLKDLSKIIKELENLGYYDSFRIAHEIIDYSVENSKVINEILELLKTGQPWEQIRGWTEFCDTKILVSKDTLIPRVETEQILDIIKEDLTDGCHIYDIGTGSGAIAIAIKKKYPKCTVIGSDISSEALKIAKENVKNNKLDIKLVHSDLLNNLKIEKESVIVANLPYIPTRDYNELDSSVKEFEPKIALHGGIEGLDIINKLIKQTFKTAAKALALEIDPSQEKKLASMAGSRKFVFYKDFRGLIRFFKLHF